MIVSLNIPTNYHITVSELTGIEKLKLVVRGEGKYLIEMIWHGRDVAIEVHLKNKQMSHKKAEEMIVDNLANLFASLVISHEWNPEDKKVSLIWNEHMEQLGIFDPKENSFFYKHVEKDLKDKFKKELKMLKKEKCNVEKASISPRAGSPRSATKLTTMQLPEVEQKILRLQMALELDSKKLSAKRFSLDSGLASEKGTHDAAKRASLIL